MRLLFEMDRHDYGDCTSSFVRDSARSIIFRDGKIAMIHSLKYDYYKFPGGGIEEGEDPIDALIRETKEEAGLLIVRDSIQEYGRVHRVQKSAKDPSLRFVQDNFYYLCQVRNETVAPELDDYEEEESFQLEYIDPSSAILKNSQTKGNHFRQAMLERENRVLRMLLAEGYPLIQ
ncbi:MAG: NUDIX domain-containing protein [Bacilli bacterium]|nr:NUDIX domain-containing protein [Bacilli bacterium]